MLIDFSRRRQAEHDEIAVAVVFFRRLGQFLIPRMVFFIRFSPFISYLSKMILFPYSKGHMTYYYIDFHYYL